MAFTTRSHRPEDTHPSYPGPGSYSTEKQAAEHGYAPFLSTAVRNFHPDSSSAPGPGKYAPGMPHKQGASYHSSLSAPFSTSGPRMGRHKTTSLVTPGPGNYSKGDNWAINQRRAQRGESTARVSLQRQVTAPSVPARSQVYGYEEDPAGRLVMQPPPDQGHTGVGSDKPGPLDYEPDKLRVMKCSTATGWAKSKAERRMTSTKIPGPGDYNPTTNAQTGFTRRPTGLMAGKSSSFATTALRLTQTRESFQRAPPGPGDYVTSCKDAIRATKPVPKHQQFFSSTSRRHSDVDPLKLRSAPTYMKGPGPGAYSINSAFGRQPLADPACSAFSSTQAKLKQEQETKPGPGDYDTSDEFSLFSTMTKKPSSRCTMFGSSSTRFVPESKAQPEGVVAPSDMPGPQSYNPVPPPKQSVNCPSSNFASRTRRMEGIKAPTEPKASEFEADDDVMGDPRNLGPGSHYVPSEWANHSKHGTYKPIPGFGGAERFQHQKSDSPAPGTYDWKDVNRALKPVAKHRAAFGTSDSKLPAWTARIPGPGQYEVAGSWRLRSYNVSYDDTNLV